MKHRLWRGVRAVAAIVIAWSIGWNLLKLILDFGGQIPREENVLVKLERSFTPIRFALWKEGYTGRYLGYVSPRSTVGNKVATDDGPRWSMVRYLAIPWVVLDDSRDVPYVIGDYQTGETIPEKLDGFTRIYDRGDGLILYKRDAQ